MAGGSEMSVDWQPQTPGEWFQKISSAIDRLNEKMGERFDEVNAKVGLLVDGARRLDERVDKLEQWRDKIDGGRVLFLGVVAGVSALAGLAAGIISTATGIASLIGGKHP